MKPPSSAASADAKGSVACSPCFASEKPRESGASEDSDTAEAAKRARVTPPLRRWGRSAGEFDELQVGPGGAVPDPEAAARYPSPVDDRVRRRRGAGRAKGHEVVRPGEVQLVGTLQSAQNATNVPRRVGPGEHAKPTRAAQVLGRES
jgi:hypothetical protein